MSNLSSRNNANNKRPIALCSSFDDVMSSDDRLIRTSLGLPATNNNSMNVAANIASSSNRAAPLPLPLRLSPRTGNNRPKGGASSPLSPLFVRFCMLCTLAIIGMACSFAFLSDKHSHSLKKEMQHHRLQNQQTLLRKKRKLRDYLLENGVDEPIYVPAQVESYLLKHADELGYNTKGNDKVEGCKVWNSAKEAPSIFGDLHAHLKELENYNQALESYSYTQDNNISDIRMHLTGGEVADFNTCQQLELSPSGNDLQKSFFPSGALSRTIKGGWVEPLMTPMRHPKFCTEGKNGNYLNLDYLVHDFASMCRRLKPTSRVVLFDLGASDKFAGVSKASLKLIKRFKQFGLPVNHYHAFEIKPMKNQQEMYRLAPRQLQAAHDLHVTYHWVTGGVSTERGNPQNPLTILQNEYNDDDLILLKLDIDIPEMENLYVQQILETPALLKMIDQFYFEHHVHMEEMTAAWKSSMGGSVKDTLELFTKLRERGVPAHFWV